MAIGLRQPVATPKRGRSPRPLFFLSSNAAMSAAPPERAILADSLPGILNNAVHAGRSWRADDRARIYADRVVGRDFDHHAVGRNVVARAGSRAGQGAFDELRQQSPAIGRRPADVSGR